MLLVSLLDLLENTTRFFFSIIGQNHVSMLLRAAPIARFTAFLTDEYGGSRCIQYYIETGEVRSMLLSPFDGTQKPRGRREHLDKDAIQTVSKNVASRSARHARKLKAKLTGEFPAGETANKAFSSFSRSACEIMKI